MLTISLISPDDLQTLLSCSTFLRLLEQVDAFFMDPRNLLQQNCPTLQPFMPKTLFTVSASSDVLDWHFRYVRHLRVTADNLYQLGASLKAIDPPSLQSLYLTGSAGQPGLQSLIVICKRHAIEIVRVERHNRMPDEPYISPEFWRRQREHKRLERGQ